MSGYSITCGECGKSSCMAQWVSTLLGEDLPKGHLQCPECHTAVLRKIGAPEVYEYNGKTPIYPGETTIEPTDYIISMAMLNKDTIKPRPRVK